MVDINEFNKVQSRGLQFNNRFKVILPGEGDLNSRDINLMCESVTLPGMSIDTDNRTIGLITQKMPNGISFSDVRMSFYCTADNAIREYFNNWQKSVVNSGNYYEINYKSGDGGYSKTVDIIQLHKQTEKEIYKCRLFHAFPINIEEAELNNSTATEVMKISVTLNYSHWNDIKTK